MVELAELDTTEATFPIQTVDSWDTGNVKLKNEN